MAQARPPSPAAPRSSLRLVMREHALQGMAMPGLVLLLAVASAAAGESAVAVHQFDDQLELLRKVPPIRVEYLEADTPVDRLRCIMLIRGSSYRFSMHVEEPLPHEKASSCTSNFIYSSTKGMFARLDLNNGRMEILRKDPKLDVSSFVWGERTPPILDPVGFLGWVDHSPFKVGPGVQWDTLWNKALLKARLNDLVHEEPPLTPAERRVSVAFKNAVIDQAGSVSYVARGSKIIITLRKHGEFNGAFLVDEEEVRSVPETAADPVPPPIHYAYTYKVIASSDGKGSVPILQEVTVGGEPGHMATWISLVSLTADKSLEETDLNIDATLAKQVIDLKTNLVVETH